mgnify:FL=1
MNDPEVTMSKAVAETKLVAHEKAVGSAGFLGALVDAQVEAPLKSSLANPPRAIPEHTVEKQASVMIARRNLSV